MTVSPSAWQAVRAVLAGLARRAIARRALERGSCQVGPREIQVGPCIPVGIQVVKGRKTAQSFWADLAPVSHLGVHGIGRAVLADDRRAALRVGLYPIVALENSHRIC